MNKISSFNVWAWLKKRPQGSAWDEQIKQMFSLLLSPFIAMHVNIGPQRSRWNCKSDQSPAEQLEFECTWILSHQPAKYLKVWIDMPTCVLRASVYTAPESMDSMVASSSWCSSIRSASLQRWRRGGGHRLWEPFQMWKNSCFFLLIFFLVGTV